MSLANLRLQEHLREAITWLDKGFVSKEEFEVLKHNIFLEDKERRNKVYVSDFVDCSRDGVEYMRDCTDGCIYNADFVEVGKWCTSFGDGFIEFSNEGAKKHFEATGRTLPN